MLPHPLEQHAELAYLWLIVLWVLWAIPVFLRRVRSRRGRPSKTAPISILGIIVQAAAYPIVWVTPDFRAFPLEWWRTALSFAFGIVALLLMWSAVPALGKQWRLQAGVYEDHKLVRTGVYAVIRHPIYASMLALLLAIGLLRASLLACAVAVVFMIVGTEIRIRAEDRLLAERFGREFTEYRERVRAYLPFLR